MAANIYDRVILGGVSETIWSGAFSNKALAVVCEVHADQAAKIGKQILTKLERAYKTHPPTSLAAFKNFLESATKGVPVSYCATLVIGDMLYAAALGDGAIYINREGVCAPILSGTGSVSGNLKTDDKLFLVSHEFLTRVPETIFSQVLPDEDLSRIVKTLTTHLHQHEVSHGGAVLLKINTLSQKQILPFKTIEESARQRLQLRSFWYHMLGRIERHRVLILIIIFLIVGGYVSWRWYRRYQVHQAQTALVSEVLSDSSHFFDEGMAMIDINPIKARELLRQAQDILVAKKAQAVDPASQAAISAQLQKIDAGLKTATRNFEITPEVFYQLDLLASGGVGDSTRLFEDALIILDRTHHSLYRINTQTKAAKIISTDSLLANAKSIAVGGEDVYALTDQIYDLGPDGTFKSVISDPAQEKHWVNPALINVYGGNIYLLDTSKNWIWKYTKNDTGFAAIQDYFLFDTITDLRYATDMEIDSWVWVVAGDQILRFASGRLDSWKMTDLPSPLGAKLNIYTDATTNDVYTLDTQNQRVIVTSKDGVYEASYHWQMPLEVTDFVVSEAIKKIFLLSRGTIYAITLR